MVRTESTAAPGEIAAPPRLWGLTFTGPLVGVVVLAVVAAFTAGPFTLTLLSQSAIFAIVVLGLNVLVGYTGQISFGHNAFFGVGAYLTAYATTTWKLPPFVGLVLGIVAALVLAVLIGYPTLRLRGHFLAMATFGLGLVFYSFVAASPIFKGFTGIGGIPALGVGTTSTATPIGQYAVSVAFLLVAIVVAWRLRHRRFGRALSSIANDESAGQSIGIDVHRYKLAAFAISAVFGAIAGWLYAHTVTYVSPETFGFTLIITIFTMLFFGGLGSVWGAVVGSIVVTVLPQLVPRAVQNWEPTIFSVILLAVLVIRPAGLLAPSTRLNAALAGLLGRSRRADHDG